jgi:hypothetical protein
MRRDAEPLVPAVLRALAIQFPAHQQSADERDQDRKHRPIILHRIGLAALLVLAWAGPASATTWYANASTGNNANNCTSAVTACLNLDGVNAKAVAAGDTVEVSDAATYVGVGVGAAAVRVTWTKSGSAGSVITIRGANHATCTTTTGDTRTTAAGNTLTLTTDNLHPTGYRANPSTIVPRIVLNASYVTLECLEVQMADSINDPVNIIGTDRVGITVKRIAYLDSDAYSCETGVDMDNNVSADIPSDIRITENFFRQCAVGINANYHNSLIDLNEIKGLTSSPRDYMRIGGTFNTVRRNYKYGGNLDGCPGCHIDCLQHFNLENPPVSDHKLQDLLYEQNVCLNFHQAVLTEDQTTGTRAYTGRIERLVFRNNIVADGVSASDPLQYASYAFGLGSAGTVEVYNNTCYNMLYCAAFGDGSFGVVKNNIGIAMASATPLSIAVGTTMTHSDNLFYSPPCDGGATIHADACGRTYSAVTYPDDIVNADPLVTDRTVLDFRLQSGSPAIGAGATGLGVTLDFLGNVRDVAPDIGAFEFGASPPALIRLRQNPGEDDLAAIGIEGVRVLDGFAPSLALRSSRRRHRHERRFDQRDQDDRRGLQDVHDHAW